MLEKTIEGLTATAETVPNGLVVAMGIGIVFVGLISIVIICSIMSAILAPKGKKTVEAVKAAPTAAVDNKIENRQEIIAAVSAVIAEELGTDISALRIHSFKKI